MNVFLVMTPLQLINALEAKQHFGTTNNTLIVLRHSSLGYPISMFKRLIRAGDWDHIHFLSTFDAERVEKLNLLYWHLLCARQRRRLDRLAARLGPAEGMFIGQYHEPIARHFSNTLPYRTLYLIDDGTSTLETNDERHGRTRPRLPERLRAAFRDTLTGLRTRQAERVVFFSAYDIVPRTGDTLVKNHFTHFRQHIAAVPQNDEVWFLGEPLSLDGYVGKETYLETLALAQTFYRNARFVYLPHSREQRSDVAEIQAALGCEVRRYGLPVEVVLSGAKERPKEVASFITSAIPNCAIMFGPTLQLTSVYLEPRQLLNYHAFTEGVYDHFRHDVGPNVRVLTRSELGGHRSGPDDPHDGLNASKSARAELGVLPG